MPIVFKAYSLLCSKGPITPREDNMGILGNQPGLIGQALSPL